jgi:CHASE2 domain-containing sensor protein
VNLGCSTIGLLLISAIAVASWFLAPLAGWSRLITFVVMLAVVLLVGGLQLWRAQVRHRRLVRDRRWPPDTSQGAV